MHMRMRCHVALATAVPMASGTLHAARHQSCCVQCEHCAGQIKTYVLQAEVMGREFRNVMYPRYGPAGGGLLRLHSTYRHDLKINSSDEGRVQTSAAAFTQGLLDLEGDLTHPHTRQVSPSCRCCTCLECHSAKCSC